MCRDESRDAWEQLFANNLRPCAFPVRRDCLSAAEQQSQRVVTHEQVGGQRLQANAGSCRHFHAGQVNFLGRLGPRISPRFQIKRDGLFQILLCRSERFPLRSNGKIQAARDEPDAVVLEHCMDSSHNWECAVNAPR
jgi:hypothetical protein